MEDICLAEFAVKYKAVSKYKVNEDEENSDDEDVKEEESDVIYLSNGLGIMKKRCKLAVLRYHKISDVQDPDRYYYSQMLLFKHWRVESDFLMTANFQQYLDNIHEILKNKNMFQQHKEIVENALDKFQEHGPPTHMFEEYASEIERQNLEDENEEILLDKDSAVLLPDEEYHQFNDINVQIQTTLTFGIENRPTMMTDADYFSHIRYFVSYYYNMNKFILSFIAFMKLKMFNYFTGH